MANDPKAMYDNGELSSKSSRRNSILSRFNSAAHSVSNTGRAVAGGVGSTLYDNTLSDNAPEIIKSHKDAAALLLGGPLGSMFVRSMAEKTGGLISRINERRLANKANSSYDEPANYNMDREDKGRSAISEAIEHIDETFKNTDGSKVKRTTKISTNGKRQTIEYNETQNKKATKSLIGRRGIASDSVARSGGNGNPSNSMMSNNLENYNKYGSSDNLTKKDLAFITNLSQSITAKLEKSEEKKRSSTRFGFFGTVGALMVIPALGVLNVARYSTQLPNAKKVGVLNAMNITLGLLYTASRANMAETNRLLYDLAVISKQGLNVKYNLRKPAEVTTFTEAVSQIPSAALKGAVGLAKFGLRGIGALSAATPDVSGGLVGMMGGGGRGRGSGNNKKKYKNAGDIFSSLKGGAMKAGGAGVGLMGIAALLGVSPMTLLSLPVNVLTGLTGMMGGGGAVGSGLMGAASLIGGLPLSTIAGLGLAGVAGYKGYKGGKRLYKSAKANFSQLKDIHKAKGFKGSLRAVKNFVFKKNEEPDEGSLSGFSDDCCDKLLGILHRNAKRDSRYQREHLAILKNTDNTLSGAKAQDKKQYKEHNKIIDASFKIHKKTLQLENKSYKEEHEERKEAGFWRKFNMFSSILGGGGGILGSITKVMTSLPGMIAAAYIAFKSLGTISSTVLRMFGYEDAANLITNSPASIDDVTTGGAGGFKQIQAMKAAKAAEAAKAAGSAVGTVAEGAAGATPKASRLSRAAGYLGKGAEKLGKGLSYIPGVKAAKWLGKKLPILGYIDPALEGVGELAGGESATHVAAKSALRVGGRWAGMAAGAKLGAMGGGAAGLAAGGIGAVVGAPIGAIGGGILGFIGGGKLGDGAANLTDGSPSEISEVIDGTKSSLDASSPDITTKEEQTKTLYEQGLEYNKKAIDQFKEISSSTIDQVRQLSNSTIEQAKKLGTGTIEQANKLMNSGYTETQVADAKEALRKTPMEFKESKVKFDSLVSGGMSKLEALTTIEKDLPPESIPIFLEYMRNMKIVNTGSVSLKETLSEKVGQAFNKIDNYEYGSTSIKDLREGVSGRLPGMIDNARSYGTQALEYGRQSISGMSPVSYDGRFPGMNSSPYQGGSELTSPINGGFTGFGQKVLQTGGNLYNSAKSLISGKFGGNSDSINKSKEYLKATPVEVKKYKLYFDGLVKSGMSKLEALKEFGKKFGDDQIPVLMEYLKHSAIVTAVPEGLSNGMTLDDVFSSVKTVGQGIVDHGSEYSRVAIEYGREAGVQALNSAGRMGTLGSNIVRQGAENYRLNNVIGSEGFQQDPAKKLSNGAPTAEEMALIQMQGQDAGQSERTRKGIIQQAKDVALQIASENDPNSYSYQSELTGMAKLIQEAKSSLSSASSSVISFGKNVLNTDSSKILDYGKRALDNVCLALMDYAKLAIDNGANSNFDPAAPDPNSPVAQGNTIAGTVSGARSNGNGTAQPPEPPQKPSMWQKFKNWMSPGSTDPSVTPPTSGALPPSGPSQGPSSPQASNPGVTGPIPTPSGRSAGPQRGASGPSSPQTAPPSTSGAIPTQSGRSAGPQRGGPSATQSGSSSMAGGAVDASTLYQQIGASPEQWDIYRNTVAKIESGGKYDIYGGSNDHYDGRYQLGKSAKIDGARHAGIADPGHSKDPNDPSRVAYRQNNDLQETLFTGFTLGNHKYLMKNETYKNATIERKLQILGYAHNQGMGGAEKWINTGVVGSDGFGTKGTKYTDAIAANLKSSMGPTQTPEVVASTAPVSGAIDPMAISASSEEEITPSASASISPTGSPIAATETKKASAVPTGEKSVEELKDEIRTKLDNNPQLKQKYENKYGMSSEELLNSKEVTDQLNSIRIGNNVSSAVVGGQENLGKSVDRVGENINVAVNQMTAVSSNSNSSTRSNSNVNANNSGGVTDGLPQEVQALMFGLFD